MKNIGLAYNKNEWLDLSMVKNQNRGQRVFSNCQQSLGLAAQKIAESC